jgi:hypothetical protein
LSKKIHGNKFGYDKTVYIKMHTNVLLFCKKHKYYFAQTPNKHIRWKHGCPKCNESHGEKLITGILEKRDIKYIPQNIFFEFVV